MTDTTDEQDGEWMGSLVAKTTEGGLEWYFGPTERIPFGEECINCGEEWDPSCVFDKRTYVLSKQGRAALDRLCETGGQFTDVRHLADWLLDWRERMQQSYRDMPDDRAASIDETLVNSMKKDGGTPDRHVDELRFSGFEVMPIDAVAKSVSGQRFEGHAYANLSLLIHAISFAQVRSGELHSDPDLNDGFDDIVTKCHTVMQTDTEGVLYYRHLQDQCWICGRNLPDGEGVWGIACEDGECHERLGGDPNIIGRETGYE